VGNAHPSLFFVSGGGNVVDGLVHVANVALHQLTKFYMYFGVSDITKMLVKESSQNRVSLTTAFDFANIKISGSANRTKGPKDVFGDT
jgi:hypothetical protein